MEPGVDSLARFQGCFVAGFLISGLCVFSNFVLNIFGPTWLTEYFDNAEPTYMLIMAEIFVLSVFLSIFPVSEKWQMYFLGFTLFMVGLLVGMVSVGILCVALNVLFL